MTRPTVEEVRSRKRQIRAALRKLAMQPEYQAFVDWVESSYDKPMLPAGAMTLERLVGQHDVFRDIRNMMTREDDNETQI